MKWKSLAILMAVALALSLCACGGGSSNVFLAAETEDHPTEGGGMSRTIRVNKADAMAATEEEYGEFIEKMLDVAEEEDFELFGMIFEDGTGITYYGCWEGNAVYGEINSKGQSIEDYGRIFPDDDGPYYFVSYEDWPFSS